MQHDEDDGLFGDEVIDYLMYKDVMGEGQEKKAKTGCFGMLIILALPLPVVHLLASALSALIPVPHL